MIDPTKAISEPRQAGVVITRLAGRCGGGESRTLGGRDLREELGEGGRKAFLIPAALCAQRLGVSGRIFLLESGQ